MRVGIDLGGTKIEGIALSDTGKEFVIVSRLRKAITRKS
jgi:predicted NBD/HSP70 family sugar kinase